MHNSRKVFLLDEDKAPVCIKAIYDEGERGKEFKTFDRSIQVGDRIVVGTDTRLLQTVCEVTEIDIEPDLDSNSVIEWVIHKIDLTQYENTLAVEEKLVVRIRKGEKMAKRKALREAMLGDIDVSDVQLIEGTTESVAPPTPPSGSVRKEGEEPL